LKNALFGPKTGAKRVEMTVLSVKIIERFVDEGAKNFPPLGALATLLP